ncbi:MAG: hypothetical protein MI717_02640 [Spirochaetales bacterium]|nr:hypothetical protein [Spirochaetales bacterium]
MFIQYPPKTAFAFIEQIKFDDKRSCSFLLYKPVKSFSDGDQLTLWFVTQS